MEARELVGRWAIRGIGAVMNCDDVTHDPIRNYSFTDSPIFIIKVTDNHIVFRSGMPGIDEPISGIGILDERWLDNGWVDSKKNREEYKKLAYTVVNIERKMKAGELVKRWAIRTKPYLNDWSYTNSPIFIIKATKRGIVYHSDLLFKHKHSMGKEWLDDNWTDYEELVHAEESVKPENIVKLLLSKLAALLNRIKLLIRNLWSWLKKKMTIIIKEMVCKKPVINLP